MKPHLFAFILMFFCTATCWSQTTIKSMKETTDFIPAADQRRDFNKQLCALVKIQVVDEITDVEGNIMGDIVNKGVEKWVYMAKDSRNMKIHLKNNLPVKVMFRDYDIDGLKSNRVYELIIDAPNLPATDHPNEQYGSLKMNIQPVDATISIWGDNMQSKTYKPDANGELTVQLPYGRYYYKVTAVGYSSMENSIFVNDQGNLETVKLEQLKGSIIATCQTKDVIYTIDGGVAKSGKTRQSWTYRLPEGKHTITVTAKGLISQTKTFDVKANQSTRVDFTVLKSEKDLKKEEAKKRQRERQLRADSIKMRQKAAHDSIGKIKREARQIRLAAKNSQTVVFGLQGGYNMATAKFSNGEGTESISSFFGGITLDFRVIKSLYLNTALLYSQKGYKYNHIDIRESGSAQYLELPVLLSPRFKISNSFTIELSAGPYVALCVGGNVTDDYYDSIYDEKFSSAYSGIDYGVQAGLGFIIFHNFRISASYQFGMDSKYPNRNLMVGLNVRF